MNAADKGLQSTNDEKKRDYYNGKIQAAKYYIDWELPLISRDLTLLNQNNDVCASMRAQWF